MLPSTVPQLPPSHPCAEGYLDETGVIATDDIFAVGCFVTSTPHELLGAIRSLRSRRTFTGEYHFNEVTHRNRTQYRDFMATLAADPNWTFNLVLADRTQVDVVKDCGDRWRAYEELAIQLLTHCLGNSTALLAVLADEYTAPKSVRFEATVRDEVNRRLGRLGVPAVVRVNSKANDLMQVTDVLTSIAAFPTRVEHELASETSVKGKLASKFWRDHGSRIRVHDYRPPGHESLDTTLETPYASG